MTAAATEASKCTLHRCASKASESPALKGMLEARGHSGKIPFVACIVAGVSAAALISYFLKKYEDDDDIVGADSVDDSSWTRDWVKGSSFSSSSSSPSKKTNSNNNNNNNNNTSLSSPSLDDGDDLDFSAITPHRLSVKKIETRVKQLEDGEVDLLKKDDSLFARATDESITKTMIKLDTFTPPNESEKKTKKELIRSLNTLGDRLAPYLKKK